MQNFYLGKGSKGPVKPEVLYKRSHLYLDPTSNKIWLKALAHNVRYGPNADATCASSGLHFSTPSRFCDCGFYAYKNYLDALSHPQTSNFILRVVASGKMFEYDKGYRYEHQRVEEVIASHCVYTCGEAPDRLRISETTWSISPVCSYHARYDKDSLMSFSEFEETISASLPEGAPSVTIRSKDKKVTPWVRKKKIPLRKRLHHFFTAS